LSRRGAQNRWAFAEWAAAAAVLCVLALCALYARGADASAQEPQQPQQSAPRPAPDRSGESAEERPQAINALPFVETVRRGVELYRQGKLGPATRLDMAATAKRLEDGTLDLNSVKLTSLSADDDLLALAQQLLVAVSQSRILAGLEGASDVTFGLRLDERVVAVRISCEMPTERDANRYANSERDANRYANGYSALLGVGAQVKKGTREGELYKKMQITSEGKLFTFRFEMPKEEAGRMLAEALAKSGY
jgi:hypothetical protein